MQIFIDESGNFAEGTDWSLVCSLALPDKELGPTRRELHFRSRDWPKAAGELKGSLLCTEHLQALVDILFRHSAVMHVCAIHAGGENFAEICAHQQGQGEGITKFLVPEHHPNMVAQVWDLRRTLERMPPQLYLQCVAQSELVVSAIEENVMYFSQRRPKELARFGWTVDAKDPQRISTQEKWWRDTLGPLLESRSVREPFRFVRDPDFDLTHFHRSYRSKKDMWFPDRPRAVINGIDIKKIIMEAVSFADSRTDILLQAADVLANFSRRTLSGGINDDGVDRALGRLQFARREDVGKGPPQCVRILTLSRSPNDALARSVALKRKLDLMASTTRTMIRKRKGRRRQDQDEAG